MTEFVFSVIRKNPKPFIITDASSRFIFYRHGCHGENKSSNKTWKPKLVVSLANQCSFHISGFYSFIWPGIRWNKCTPKHKVADRMRLFHPGKNFSGGKVEEYTEMLGPFIAVPVKLLIKPTGNHCQGAGCTRTEKWPFFLVTKILKCEVGVFPKTQKCFTSPPLGQRLNDGRTFLARKNWQVKFLSSFRNNKLLFSCWACHTRQAAMQRQIYVEPGPGCLLLREIYDFNKCSS